MMAGRYALHLYCDEENTEHKYNEFPHEYYHEFGSTCRRLAREDGWLLKNNKEICPKCAKK